MNMESGNKRERKKKGRGGMYPWPAGGHPKRKEKKEGGVEGGGEVAGGRGHGRV